MRRLNGLLMRLFKAKRVLLGLGLFLIGAVTAYGQQDIWQGPLNGSWFTGSDWSLGAPPTASESAIINSGAIVQVPSGNAVTASLIVAGTLDMSGGALTVNGAFTIDKGASVVFTNGVIFTNAFQDNGTIAVDNPVGGVFGANVSGSGGLVVNIQQTLSVSAQCTYFGQTFVNTGTLQAASTTAFSPNSAFVVSSTLDLNGFNNTIGSLSGNGVVTNGLGETGIRTATTGAILTVSNDNTNSTFSGILEDGTGLLGLTKIGTGVLTLTGRNTYTGGTIIDGGVLQLGDGGKTGSIVGNVVDNATLVFDRSGIYTFGGVISGTGAVQQIATGTLVLTGNNNYTGGTTISGDILQLGVGGTTGTITGNVANNGTLLINLSDTFTLGGVISGTGSVQQFSVGTTVLTGNNTYTGGTTISKGTLQLGNGGTSGTITGNVMNNGTLVFDLSDIYVFSGVITGKGAVQQIGTGTTVLTANNTYSSGTTISAGTLMLGNGGTSGTVAGNVTDNGTLAFDHSDVLTFAGLISGTGAVQQIGTGATVLTANNTYSGETTISAGTLQLGNGGTTGNIFGNITDNGILAFDRSNELAFLGVISGTGTVQQIGTGTTVLTADNTYSGGTIIKAGTLQLGDDEITGSITGNVLDDGTLAFDRSDILTIVGVIGGTGVVRQIGVGTTVLTGNNTYSGRTTITAGTLQLGSGGTTGSIIGNVTDNGALAFDRSNLFAFGGQIGGTGLSNKLVPARRFSPQTIPTPAELRLVREHSNWVMAERRQHYRQHHRQCNPRPRPQRYVHLCGDNQSGPARSNRSEPAQSF